MLGTPCLEQAWCRQQGAPATLPKGILLHPHFSWLLQQCLFLLLLHDTARLGHTAAQTDAPVPPALPLCLDPLPPPSALQPTPVASLETLISLSYLMESLAEHTILGWKKNFHVEF